ncbi:L,D-transpeptidase [Bauldia litoralis]|uniref:L,D-transpeptidase catalytic domain n=1 Tax=Bauldia litoralis TaxID=665467 RepID=A0A1G6DFZ3_9HYPH|nr:L,D-transpeptidase [Bauldia litoralis]SDB44050.1 L,D-transpeptidase catalytic domain [Bauldia litoralis]
MRLLGIAVALFALAFAFPAAAAKVEARIDISSQRMVVKVNGVSKYTWPVSTGRSGYATPTGTYRPQRLEKNWYSRKYDNAPMPYSVFFRGGYAIHGTTSIRNLGRPASHGCVRLHPSNAAKLYSLIQQYGMGNARVVVTR